MIQDVLTRLTMCVWLWSRESDVPDAYIFNSFCCFVFFFVDILKVVTRIQVAPPNASAAIQSGHDLINCNKSKHESKISSSNALHRHCWLAAGSKLFMCFSTVVGLKAALSGTS